MKTTQRGFIVPLLLIIVAILLAGGGAYFYTQTKSENPLVTENVILPQATSTVPTTSQTAPVTQTSTVGRLCGGGAMANGGACPAGYLCEIVTKGPPAEGTCQVATASPTISSIEVVEGLPTGSVYAGQTAEIFGTDLRGVVSVKIGEQNVPIRTGFISDLDLDTDQVFTVPSLPAGVYNVSVTNSSMQTSNVYPVTVVVYVLSSPQTFITVTYPNGGETLKAGNTYSIRWNTSGLTNQDNVYISIQDMSSTNSVSTTINAGETSATKGQYNWTIPSDYKIGSMYTIKVYTNRQTYGDLSDAYFTITK
jgi:hypothetical protein